MHQDLPQELSLGRLFGLADAPCLHTRPVRDAVFGVTYLDCRVEAHSPRVVTLPKQDCFFLMLYLEDTRHCDLMDDGCEHPLRTYRKGSMCLVDLAEGASIRLYETLQSLAFIIPRALLAEVSEFSSAPAARSLRCLRGTPDDVVFSLGKVLLPLLDQQQFAPSPVLGHVAVAICAHLLHRHGDIKDPQESRFAEFQEKKTTDLWVKDFENNAELDAMTHAAGLPIAHFSKAFQLAKGQTLQAWLILYRVALAKRYLAEHEHSFHEIASLSGFRDAAHFFDDFTTVTGFSPEVWRKRWLN